jgi:hypothetical protein
MEKFENTGKTTHCDALGNPIEIGKAYGFSKNVNGLTQVIIGVAKKLTDHGVTLTVISSCKALYDYDSEPEETKASVTTRGMMMFPIPPAKTRNPGTFIHGNNNGFAHLDD